MVWTINHINFEIEEGTLSAGDGKYECCVNALTTNLNFTTPVAKDMLNLCGEEIKTEATLI